MEGFCFFAGALASITTQILKRVPFVERYPKVVAAALTGAYAYTVGTGWECWFAAFATAIAGYEVIIKPVARKEGSGERP